MTPHDAIHHFKTQTRLAAALGMSQSSVAEWVSNGYIPLPRQYQIELATDGALKADKPALRTEAA